METPTIEALSSAGIGVLLLIAVVIFTKVILVILKDSREERAITGERHREALDKVICSHTQTMDANTTAVTKVSDAVMNQQLLLTKNMELCNQMREKVSDGLTKSG